MTGCEGGHSVICKAPVRYVAYVPQYDWDSNSTKMLKVLCVRHFHEKVGKLVEFRRIDE
jgi:hypothetical protein